MNPPSSVLYSELIHIRSEVKNEKPAPRGKVIDRLNDLFDNREQDVAAVLSREDSSANWNDLFSALHEAIQLQATNLNASTAQAVLNKTNTHINAVQKCVNIANRNEQNITYKSILKAALEIFAENRLAKHFALCYLQVVTRNILQCRKGNLATVMAEEWKSKNSYIGTEMTI